MSEVKRLVRNAAYHLLRLSGGISRTRRARNRTGDGTVAILVFHGVNPTVPEDGVTIRPARFRRILEALTRGYVPISLAETVARIREGRAFTGREVCITFDDGYLDNYEYAFPLLQEYGFPACFFLTAGYVGTSKTFPWDAEKGRTSDMMSWAHAREMAEAGFEIGCHTWSHPDLGTEPIASARRELYDARDRIEQETGVEVPFFAYPFGGADNIRGEWREAVAEAGFACNCTAMNLHATAKSDLWMLHRIGASPQRSVTELRIDIDEPW